MKKFLGLFLSLSLLAGSVCAINNPFAGAGDAIAKRTPNCVKKVGRELYNYRGTVGAVIAIAAGSGWVLSKRKLSELERENDGLANTEERLKAENDKLTSESHELNEELEVLKLQYNKALMSAQNLEAPCKKLVESQSRAVVSAEGNFPGLDILAQAGGVSHRDEVEMLTAVLEAQAAEVARLEEQLSNFVSVRELAIKLQDNKHVSEEDIARILN